MDRGLAGRLGGGDRCALGGGRGGKQHPARSRRLKHLKFADGTADVAYWTVPAARGKGVCPRAVDAMASWAFEVAGFHRLDLEHAIGNTASCRVAGKTGFAVEGVRRSAWLLADGRHDVHAHARLRP